MNSSWKENCPGRVRKCIANLSKKDLKLVNRLERTKFVVRDGLKGKFTVSINRKHTCSCRAQQPCTHVLFVLISHFKLAESNALVWQDGICEAEIIELLSTQKVKDDSSCCLCRGQIYPKSGCAYCKEVFHWHCAQLRSRALQSQEITCCRCNKKLEKSSVIQNLCSACCTDCETSSYKCNFCPSYRLCNRCYTSRGVHTHHPFSKEDSRQKRSPATVTPEDINSLLHREINPEDYNILLSLDTNVPTTLSMRQFEKLPRFVWHSSMDRVPCSICLEEFAIDDLLVRFPCGHFFHLECSRKWTTEHNAVCPIDHRTI